MLRYICFKGYSSVPLQVVLELGGQLEAKDQTGATPAVLSMREREASGSYRAHCCGRRAADAKFCWRGSTLHRSPQRPREDCGRATGRVQVPGTQMDGIVLHALLTLLVQLTTLRNDL